MVNGKSAVPAAYAIGDLEYIKLRDLAFLSNGTEKQFLVFVQDEMRAVNTFACAA